MDNPHFPAIIDALEQILPEDVPLQLLMLLLQILDKAKQQANKETLISRILALFTTYSSERYVCEEIIEPFTVKMFQFISNPELSADSKQFIEAYSCIANIYDQHSEFMDEYLVDHFHLVEMMLSHLTNKLPVTATNPQRSPLVPVFSEMVHREDIFGKVLAQNITLPQIFRQVIANNAARPEVVCHVYSEILHISAASTQFEEMLFADTEFVAQMLDNMQNADLRVRLEAAGIIAMHNFTIESLRVVLEQNIIIESFCRLFNLYCGTMDITEFGYLFFRAFGHWLKLGEEFVDNDLVLYNPVALKLEESGAVETLK